MTERAMVLQGLRITGMTLDSREVKPGYLFAALPGKKVDGRDYIAAAIKAGVVAILAPSGTKIEAPGVVLVESDNPRLKLSELAAAFYSEQVPNIVAITGTNGKSSVVNFCRQIWQHMGYAGASMGTIGISAPGLEREAKLTTPDIITLHEDVDELARRGVTHLAMEASSMGLHNYRLDGLKLKAAGFLNLTRDHLDDHGTMENYLQAKLRLFTEVLPADGIAVVNMDMTVADAVQAACKARGIRQIGVGHKGEEIRLNSCAPSPAGQKMEITVFGAHYAFELPLVGVFQAENILTALGLVLAEGIDNKEFHSRAVNALKHVTSVRGRLEFAARLPNGAAVYVDYAHSPDGIETMLKAIRPHTPGRLHIVFGCGGDRDRGKRPMMGGLATTLADVVIVTDDNPRTEDAAFVRNEIMQNCPGGTEIAGRREAIRTAVRGLQPGDVLVVAGKGHEQGQIVGKDVLPFDDVTEVKLAVDMLRGA